MKFKEKWVLRKKLKKWGSVGLNRIEFLEIHEKKEGIKEERTHWLAWNWVFIFASFDGCPENNLAANKWTRLGQAIQNIGLLGNVQFMKTTAIQQFSHFPSLGTTNNCSKSFLPTEKTKTTVQKPHLDLQTDRRYSFRTPLQFYSHSKAKFNFFIMAIGRLGRLSILITHTS